MTAGKGALGAADGFEAWTVEIDYVDGGPWGR
jgi:hypothetical protein